MTVLAECLRSAGREMGPDGLGRTERAAPKRAGPSARMGVVDRDHHCVARGSDRSSSVPAEAPLREAATIAARHAREYRPPRRAVVRPMTETRRGWRSLHDRSAPRRGAAYGSPFSCASDERLRLGAIFSAPRCAEPLKGGGGVISRRPRRGGVIHVPVPSTWRDSPRITPVPGGTVRTPHRPCA